EQGRVRALDRRHAAQARAEVDADPLGVALVDAEAGVVLGHLRRGDGELQEAVVGLGVALLQPARRFPVLDLNGELSRAIRRVEQGQRTEPALARGDRIPRLVAPDADGRHEANAGDDNTTVHVGSYQPGSLRFRRWRAP